MKTSIFFFLQLDTADIEWQGWYFSRRVIHSLKINTCQNCFIYHLSKINAYIFGFLMPLDKEKILRIIFPLSRCVALRDVKIPLIITWLYLVDVYMFFL